MCSLNNKLSAPLGPTVRRRLNQAREKSKLTQKELAARLNLSPNSCRAYAEGKRTPCELAATELLRRITEFEASLNPTTKTEI